MEDRIHEDFREIVIDLQNRIEAKGYVSPKAEISFNFLGEDFSVHLHRHSTSKSERVAEYLRGGTLAEAVDAALARIETWPDPREEAKRDFLAKMGELIEQGREIGIDDDFVNPLSVMMKELSENVITDQSSLNYDDLPF